MLVLGLLNSATVGMECIRRAAAFWAHACAMITGSQYHLARLSELSVTQSKYAENTGATIFLAQCRRRIEAIV